MTIPPLQESRAVQSRVRQCLKAVEASAWWIPPWQSDLRCPDTRILSGTGAGTAPALLPAAAPQAELRSWWTRLSAAISALAAAGHNDAASVDGAVAARVREALGIVAVWQGDPVEAARQFTAAVTAAEAAGNSAAVGRYQARCAEILLHQGQHGPSRCAFSQAASILEQAGEAESCARVWAALCRHYLVYHRGHDALLWAQKADDELTRLSSVYRAEALAWRVVLLQACGQAEAAEAHHHELTGLLPGLMKQGPETAAVAVQAQAILDYPSILPAAAIETGLLRVGQFLQGQCSDLPAPRAPQPGWRAAQPQPPRLLLGRAAEIARLDDVTGPVGRRGWPVVAMLSGEPGVGTTALALSWAVQRQDRFPGGVIHLEVRCPPWREPGEHAQALIEYLLCELGAPELASSACPSQGRAAQLAAAVGRRAATAGGPVLIVLDGAEDPAAVHALLPRSPHCAVLILTRHRLSLEAGQEVVELPVGPMPAEAALEFLTRSCGRADPAVLRKLAARCHGNPLALHLLAGTLAASPHQDASAVPALLRSLTALSSTGQDVHAPAHLVLAGVVQVVLDRLPTDIAHDLRLLACLPYPVLTATIAQPALQAQTPREAVLRLHGLAARSLLAECGSDRFCLPAALVPHIQSWAGPGSDTECGRTRLAVLQSLRTAAHQATTSLLQSLPQDAPATEAASARAAQERALGWLEDHRAALLLAVAAGEGEAVVLGALAKAVAVLSLVRGGATDWVSSLERTLGSARVRAHPSVRFVLRVWLAVGQVAASLHTDSEQAQQARSLAHDALVGALASPSGRNDHGAAQPAVTRILEIAGEAPAVTALLVWSLALAERSRQYLMAGLRAWQLGQLLARTGETAEAITHLDTAAQLLSRAQQRQQTLVGVLVCAAAQHIRIGAAAQAFELLQRAWNACEEDDPVWLRAAVATAQACVFALYSLVIPARDAITRARALLEAPGGECPPLAAVLDAVSAW
ncbi:MULTISPECIES: ATP-binding protein [unclassified Crossiella]|uniref:ATP-binding protein n=1 Tax=unclassified Crossiella TaxID=2620835 RepID=UPI001FFF2C73|nr:MULTISPECIES: ATP-binding protein [unclassified Crossiella]MCK2245248.1 ATP-binding protein [Crossiella sp. S99.2]MCK2258901.1 ATP-binding protein [Crossiella sp. S99.1]